MSRHTEIADGIGHWLMVTTVCLGVYHVGKYVYRKWVNPRITRS